MTGAFELRTMGRLLAQGRTLDATSRVLLGLAGAGLLLAALAAPTGHTVSWPALAAMAVSFLTGVVQLYYALRVGFDADLVTALAERCDTPAAGQDAAAMLDASLQSLGLLDPRKAGRDWTQRWLGMRGLLQRQALCLIVQAGAFLLALSFALLFTPG